MKFLVLVAILAFSMATKAEVTPAKVATPAAPVATQTPSKKSDRVLILEKELADTKERIAAEKAKEPINLAQVNRLYGDVVALERELAMALKEPVTNNPIRPTAPVASPETASVKAPAVAASEPVPVTYEAWDIFKNFGKK